MGAASAPLTAQDKGLTALDEADAASADHLRAQLAEHGYALIDLAGSTDCTDADAFAAAVQLFAEDTLGVLRGVVP